MAKWMKHFEQSVPKGDTPAKAFKRKQPASSTSYKGNFKPKQDLPRGTIEQHRAKSGRTSQS